MPWKAQYNSPWHTGAGTESISKRSYWLEEGEEVGDGRAKGLLAIGDGGQAVISIMPDADGTGSVSFYLPSWKKRSSNVQVVVPFFSSQVTRQHWIALWMAAETFVYHSKFGSCASEPTVAPPIKTIPCHFLHRECLQLSSYFFLSYFFVLSLGFQFHQFFISKLHVCIFESSHVGDLLY